MPVTLLRHRCDAQYADDSWVTVMGLKQLQRTCGFSQWNRVIATRLTATSHLHHVAESAAVIVSELCAGRASEKLMVERVCLCV